MKYDEFSEREVENMKNDALTAIDALEAIVVECNSDYVSRRYLKEKSDKAKWLIDFINEAVNGRAE
jgi:hypothetical protein